MSLVLCVMFSTAQHAVPLFQLRSTLLDFQRQSGPVAVLVQTFHDRIRNFDENQNAGWATLEGGQEPLFTTIFCREQGPQGGKFPIQLRAVPLQSTRTHDLNIGRSKVVADRGPL